MPISKERQKLYPKNWKEIAQWVVIRAGNKCEICDVGNKENHHVTGSKVVLTVHHQNFNPRINKLWNLIALCQRCHLRLDKRWKFRHKEEKGFPAAVYP